MSNQSGIEWLAGDDGSKGLTVNPVIGCSRVSPGCGGGYIKGPNGEQGGCWAEHLVSTRMSKNAKLPMYADLARHGGGWSGIVKTVPSRLADIVALGRRKKGARVFVCDMSDMFHEAVPFEFIAAIWGAMACAPNHLFYVLTKRPERALEWASQPNIIGQVALMRELGLAGRFGERFSERRTAPLPNWPNYFATTSGEILSGNGSPICLWCGTDISGYAKRKYCSSPCRSKADYEQRCGRWSPPITDPVRINGDVGCHGHERVTLYRSGVSERHLVHRLILETFDRSAKPGEQACHLDGDATNNHLWNLRWGTAQDNAADRLRHGRARANHKLSEDEVSELRRLSHNGMRCADIAKTAIGTKVSDTQIRNIVAHAQWRAYQPIEWPLPQVAFGVTVEDRRFGVPRIELARRFPARWRWASVEPQLEDLGDVDFAGIDLVVNGGEAGDGARPFDLAWARNVRDAARKAGARYFFKQAGDYAADSLAFSWKLGESCGAPAWRLVDVNDRLVASVWLEKDAFGHNWHTWDRYGVGGENAGAPTIEQAKAEAEISVARQWFHHINVGKKGNVLTRLHEDLRIRENLPMP